MALQLCKRLSMFCFTQSKSAWYWICIVITMSTFLGVGLVLAGGISPPVLDTDPLHCYVCNSHEDTENCTNPFNSSLHRAKPCNRTDSYCSVIRLDMTAESGERKMWSVERGCSLDSVCVNECVVVGERHRLYLCRSCCKTNFCNVGNGANLSKSPCIFLTVAAIAALSPWLSC